VVEEMPLFIGGGGAYHFPTTLSGPANRYGGLWQGQGPRCATLVWEREGPGWSAAGRTRARGGLPRVGGNQGERGGAAGGEKAEAAAISVKSRNNSGRVGALQDGMDSPRACRFLDGPLSAV